MFGQKLVKPRGQCCADLWDVRDLMNRGAAQARDTPKVLEKELFAGRGNAGTVVQDAL